MALQRPSTRWSPRVIRDGVAASILIACGFLVGCSNDFEQSLNNGGELLDGEQLEIALRGNTLVGTVNQFVPLTLSFADDGQMISKDDFHERAGVWRIDEQGRLCISYDDNREHCSRFYREGKLFKSFTHYGRVLVVVEIEPDQARLH